MLEELRELYQKVIDSDLFIKWKKDHPKTYLSSAFLQDDWQLDFYDPKTDRVASFLHGKMVEDALLKAPDSTVGELDLDSVKIELGQALLTIQQALERRGETEQKRIVFLQTEEEKAIWHITIISRNFNILSYKIDANIGSMLSESFNTPLSFRDQGENKKEEKAE